MFFKFEWVKRTAPAGTGAVLILHRCHITVMHDCFDSFGFVGCVDDFAAYGANIAAYDN